VQLVYGMVDKRVDWRGRAYELDANARLADAPLAPEPETIDAMN
jgi:hypothetical protein